MLIVLLTVAEEEVVIRDRRLEAATTTTRRDQGSQADRSPTVTGFELAALATTIVVVVDSKSRIPIAVAVVVVVPHCHALGEVEPADELGRFPVLRGEASVMAATCCPGILVVEEANMLMSRAGDMDSGGT